MRATLKRKRRLSKRFITRIVIVVHTFHMQVSLSSNGHEKTKETSKYKKLLISKRRIGILKKLPKQGEDSESL